MKRPSDKMLALEDQYGMGFNRILRRFALAGFNIYQTGNALGYAQGSFHRRVNELGLRHIFKEDGRRK